MTNIKKLHLGLGSILSCCVGIGTAISLLFINENLKILYLIIPCITLIVSALLIWVIVFAILKPDFDNDLTYNRTHFLTILFLSIIVVTLCGGVSFRIESFLWHKTETLTLIKQIGLYIYRGILQVGIAILMKYLIDNKEIQKFYIEKAFRLQENNARTQFEILKQQINPHFLFNALSTVKSLIRTNDVNAEFFVQSLSEVYRKLLQRQQNEYISLTEELETIETYLFMQRIRFDKNLRLEMAIDTDEKEAYLPPFSLQLLVENAIKHNIISRAKPLTIRIYTTTDKYIVVENTYQPKVEVEDSSGWGLTSLIERFKLITSRPIDIHKTDKLFLVSLPLL